MIPVALPLAASLALLPAPDATARALVVSTAGGASTGKFGVLVMAHGGTPDWNAGVLSSVEDLRAEYPLEVAFGMADAVTIQESVRKLEERDVRRIGVVRLFVSGESWYERTEQILGTSGSARAFVSRRNPHA